MIKGYWQKRYDKMCESIYLVDTECKLAYTIKVEAHVVKDKELCPSSDFGGSNISLEVLGAIAQALQEGGYIPKAAVDAELGAVKNHLEDMRSLVFKGET